jgi:hypothetical protein
MDIKKSRKCWPVYTGAGSSCFFSDFCPLSSDFWLVGEHCGGLRRRTVRSVGDPTSAYVDTSSEKQGEKPCRRKPQVSCSQVNLLRVSRPLRRGRKA